MNGHRKIAILGAGNVGATIAYTLTIQGSASEIVLVDINREKSQGEAIDIFQGTAFSPPVDIYAGDFSDCWNSDIIIVTVGHPRKPGQTRIDLAQSNVNIIKSVMDKVYPHAPDSIYVIVSNPVDILTYTIQKLYDIPKGKIFGTGTILDSARLRALLADYTELNPKNIHAYVFGEHGETSFIPWSLATIGGMHISTYCMADARCRQFFQESDFDKIDADMRSSGAKVISLKGATFYAIALSVARICDCILRDTGSLLTVSTMLHGQYGIEDVCLSLPYVIGSGGITRELSPPLAPEETDKLRHSANALKEVIASLDI
ncbi:MAG: L-lactate dehydrogenase [Oscillospiraceae bacterium]